MEENIYGGKALKLAALFTGLFGHATETKLSMLPVFFCVPKIA